MRFNTGISLLVAIAAIGAQEVVNTTPGQDGSAYKGDDVNKLLDVAEDTTATYDGLGLDGGSAPTKNLAGGSKMVDPFKDNGGAGGQELGQVLDRGGQVEKKGSSLSELFFGDSPTITKNGYDPTKLGLAGLVDGIIGVDGEEDGMINERDQDGTLTLGMEEVDETGGGSGGGGGDDDEKDDEEEIRDVSQQVGGVDVGDGGSVVIRPDNNEDFQTVLPGDEKTKETFAEVKGVDDTNERVQEDENAGEDNGTVGGKTKEETTGMDSHDRATIDTEEGTMLVGGAAGDGEEGRSEDIAQSSEFTMGSLMSEEESRDKKPVNVKGFEDNVGGILGGESDVGGADAIPAEGEYSDRPGIVDDVSTEHEASVVVQLMDRIRNEVLAWFNNEDKRGDIVDTGRLDLDHQYDYDRQRTAIGLKDELALETLVESKESLIDSQTEEEEEEGSSRSGLFFGDTPTTAMKNNYDPTKFVSAWYDGEEDGMVIEQEQDGTLALGMEKVEETGGFKDELALMDGPAMKMKGAGAEDSPSSEMMDDEANKESETFRGVGVGSPKVEEGTMVELAKQLGELENKHLRGSRLRQNQEDQEGNPLVVISQVKDILETLLEHIQTSQDLIRNGSKEEAAAIFVSLFEDTLAASQIAAQFLPQSNSEGDGDENFLADVHDYPTHVHELKTVLENNDDIISSELFDKHIDAVKANLKTFEEVERDLSPFFETNRQRRRTTATNTQFYDSGFTTYHRTTATNTADLSRRKLKSNTLFRGSDMPVGRMQGKVKLPKLAGMEKLKANMGISRERRRLEVDLAPQCQTCDSDDYKCNCDRLVDCVGDLTLYDLSVLLLGGYVDSDEDSETLGQLRVKNYAEIDLYDARQDLPGKFAVIKQLAEQIRNSATPDSGICTDLLAQLHTACDESSCSDGNSQSFQLSVNQVCNAVNTRTVLNVKTAGEFFDFQVYTVNTDREEVEQTPTTERRAVSCCRKAQGENDKEWHVSPISQDSSCETLLLPWTSEDSAQYLLLPSPVIPPLFPFRADRYDLFPQFFRTLHPWFDFGKAPWSTTGPFNKYSSRDDSWKMEISTSPMPNFAKNFDFANFEFISVSRYNDFDMKVFIDDFAQASPTPSDWHDSGLKKLNGLKIQEIDFDGWHDSWLNFRSSYFAILFDPDSGKLVKRARKEYDGPSIEKESEISFARGWLRITRTSDIFTAYYSTVQEPSNDDDWNVVLPDSDMDTGNTWGYPSRAGIAMFAGEGDVLMAKALSVNGESVPPTLTGYTPYLQRGCGAAGGAMMSLQSCAAECDEKESCAAFTFTPDLDSPRTDRVRCDGTSLIRVELPDDTPPKWTKRALGDSQCCESKGSSRTDGICFEWDSDWSYPVFIITSEIDSSHRYYIYEIPSVKLKIYYQKESPEVVLSYNECGMWLTSEYMGFDVKTGGQRKEISIGLPYHYDETTGVCTRYILKKLNVEGCVDVEIEEIDDEACTSIEDPRGYKTLRPFDMTIGANSIVEVDSQYGCDCDEVSESLGCEPVNLHGNGACSKSGSGQIGLCRLSTGSSGCNHYVHTEFDQNDVWYFKDIVPPGYIKYEGLCTADSQNLLAEITTAKSVQECTNDCGTTYHCRSAAYSETDKKCLLYSSFICERNKYETVDGSQWSTYVKNEEEGGSNFNTCPIVSYDRAEEICKDEGGYVCSKQELDDKCASFMGCSFESSFVWSSNEADVMSCPAVSFQTCGDFVTALEKLYSARDTSKFPEPNPMRRNVNENAMPEYSNDGDPNFENVNFPVAYNWNSGTVHGMFGIDMYEPFQYYTGLIDYTGGSFCNARRGPPSILADACDASKAFIAGDTTSIGLVVATANAVDDFDSNSTFATPQWLEWFLEIQDKPLLDFSGAWMTSYKNTQDPLYPASYCYGDDGINITNCTLDWLEDEINPYSENGTCYDFWDYCREKLNTDSPDWKYPVPYCENNSSLTCLEDWLNYETYTDWLGAGNSPTNDESCKDFFDYCRAELIDTHSRYSYPLPTAPTVDDYMPGYCCFDTPLDTNTDTKFWGSHHTEERSLAGMECSNRGFWYMGLSPESCNSASGQFFRSRCIVLQQCVESRPRKGQPGYNQAFEDFVTNSEVVIYDPSDQEQCKKARVALNFDGDYLDDYHVCETFNDLMCDEFFYDLSILSEGEKEPVKFEQVKYKPISYPEDAPLYFETLPDDMNTGTITKDEAFIQLKKALLISERSLEVALNTALKSMEDAAQLHLDTKQKWDDLCRQAEFQNELAEDNIKLLTAACEAQGDVLGSMCKGFVVQARGTQNYKKLLTEGGTCILAPKINEALWLIVRAVAKVSIWITRIALESVKSALLNQYLSTTFLEVAAEYTVQNYNNMIGLSEWLYPSLNIMNNNMIEQHTQMRKNLQDRHTLMVNDINQYTTCMSNYLGIQIFNALPNATAGPLTTKCQEVLGLNRRRLAGDGEGEDDEKPIDAFALSVEFGPGSFVNQTTKAVEMANEAASHAAEASYFALMGTAMLQNEMKADGTPMEAKLESLASTVNAIAAKLGLDDTNDQTNSTKSKSRKEDNMFDRNLIDLDQMEADETELVMDESLDTSVLSIESKLDSTAVEVDGIKVRIEKMEKTMERMERAMNEKAERMELVMNEKVEGMERAMNEKVERMEQAMNEKVERMERAMNEKLAEILSKL